MKKVWDFLVKHEFWFLFLIIICLFIFHYSTLVVINRFVKINITLKVGSEFYYGRFENY